MRTTKGYRNEVDYIVAACIQEEVQRLCRENITKAKVYSIHHDTLWNRVRSAMYTAGFRSLAGARKKLDRPGYRRSLRRLQHAGSIASDHFGGNMFWTTPDEQLRAEKMRRCHADVAARGKYGGDGTIRDHIQNTLEDIGNICDGKFQVDPHTFTAGDLAGMLETCLDALKGVDRIASGRVAFQGRCAARAAAKCGQE